MMEGVIIFMVVSLAFVLADIYVNQGK